MSVCGGAATTIAGLGNEWRLCRLTRSSTVVMEAVGVADRTGVLERRAATGGLWVTGTGTVAAAGGVRAYLFLVVAVVVEEGGCRDGPKGMVGSCRLSRVGRGLNRGMAIP